MTALHLNQRDLDPHNERNRKQLLSSILGADGALRSNADDIAYKLFAGLHATQESPHIPFIEATEMSPGRGIITVAMADSNFIKRTIARWLRENRIFESDDPEGVLVRGKAFPIKQGNGPIAISLYEGLLTDEVRNHEALSQLRSRLAILPRVNEDFKQMRELVERNLDTFVPNSGGPKEFFQYLWHMAGPKADGYLWGVQTYTIDNSSNAHSGLKRSEVLGLFSVNNPETEELHRLAENNVQLLLNSDQSFFVRRLPTICPIHERRQPLHICFKTYHAGGQEGVVSILCNEATPLARGSAFNLALIGKPLKEAALQAAIQVTGSDNPQVTDRESFRRCHDVLRNIPSDIAFRYSHQNLIEIARTAYSGQTAAVLLGLDNTESIATVFVNFPSSVVNRQYSDQVFRDACAKLEQMFSSNPNSGVYQIAEGGDGSLGVFFSIPCNLSAHDLNHAWEEHQVQIQDYATSWEDKVKWLTKLTSADSANFNELWAILQHSPRSYRQNTEPVRAVFDATLAQSLSADNWVKVALEPFGAADDTRSIAIYTLNKELILDESHPVLKSLGLKFKAESTQSMGGKERNITVHRYSFIQDPSLTIDDDHFNKLVARAVEEMLKKRADVDLLNSLLLSADLNLYQVRMLGGYCDLLAGRRALLDPASALSRDVKSFFSVLSAVKAHPELAELLVHGFEAKFGQAEDSTDSSVAARLKKFDRLHDRFLQSLHSEKNMPGDHASVLKALWNLIDKSDWSNYASGKETISVRVNLGAISFFAEPRPKFLKIISHPEGQYVRQMWGDNSRGGDRHVENKMDRYSVVDDLSRGQGKNWLGIGMDGGKGGWSFREEPSKNERPQRLANVLPEVHDASAAIQLNYQVHKDEQTGRIYWTIEVPSDSICLTDYGHGREWHPGERIHTDGIGPDVNTGTPFVIDAVNFMAVQRGHFRGLSYMTSGTYNISHDKYHATTSGVEAKLIRYLRDLGLMGQPLLTNAAMDGKGELGHNALISETFGNLMKIQVSVNGEWVLFNPNPSPQAIQEQMRLGHERLDLNHFQQEILSPGGGIFQRNQLNLLTPEQKQALFGSDADKYAEQISGVDIAKHAFQLPADLIYPTGITTVIYGPKEDPRTISGLPADGFSISADTLIGKVKIVIEGANLFLTPAARKCLQEAGVLCCTDSDDNSFGVTASRIDTVLGTLCDMIAKLDPQVDRATLQHSIFSEHAGNLLNYFVQHHNARRALVYSLERARSADDIDYVEAFLDKEHALVQTIGSRHLPTSKDFSRKRELGKGLLDCEHSDLVMAIKKWLIESVHESGLAIKEYEYFKPYFLRFIPDETYQQYKEYVENHLERYEFAVFEAVNDFVDTLGPAFFFRTAENHSTHPSSVIKCAIAARKILNSDEIRNFLEKIDGQIPDAEFKSLMHTLNDAERTFTDWLVALYGRPEINRAEKPLDEIIEKFSSRLRDLERQGPQSFPEGSKSAAQFLNDYQSILSKLTSLDGKTDFSDQIEHIESLVGRLALLKQIDKLAECMHAKRKVEEHLAAAPTDTSATPIANQRMIDFSHADFVKLNEALESLLGLNKIGVKSDYVLDQISEHVLFHTSLGKIRHSLWRLARSLVESDQGLTLLNGAELISAIRYRLEKNPYFSDLQENLTRLGADREKSQNNSSSEPTNRTLRASRVNGIASTFEALVGPVEN